MPRRLLLLPLALVSAAVLAGCGGSKTYALAKTRECLASTAGLRLSSKVDFVASSAPGGAVAVRMRHNDVTISFGLDRSQAERVATAYRRFRGRNIGIEDVLRPDHNAVLLWRAHPSAEDEATIRGCLK